MVVFFISLVNLKTVSAAENPNWIKSVSVSKSKFNFGQPVNTNITVELNAGPWLPADLNGTGLFVEYILPYLDDNGDEVIYPNYLPYNPKTKKYESGFLSNFEYDQIGTWELDHIVASWATTTMHAYNSNVYDSSLIPTGTLEDLSGGNITLLEPSLGWNYIEKKWYFFDADVELVTGWLYDKGKWYYLNPEDGSMVVSWKWFKGKWYYLDPIKGDMKTGWNKIQGKWYFLDLKNGDMKTGWIQDKGKWYYLNKDGSMATSTWIGKYWVDAYGVWTKTRK